MTLDFFLNNYKLEELEINKIFIKNNKLKIVVKYNVYLELIANGYRPEMNMDIDKTFIFDVDYKNHNFKSTNIEILDYSNDILTVKIDDMVLKLTGNVEVE